MGCLTGLTAGQWGCHLHGPPMSQQTPVLARCTVTRIPVPSRAAPHLSNLGPSCQVLARCLVHRAPSPLGLLCYKQGAPPTEGCMCLLPVSIPCRPRVTERHLPVPMVCGGSPSSGGARDQGLHQNPRQSLWDTDLVRASGNTSLPANEGL